MTPHKQPIEPTPIQEAKASMQRCSRSQWIAVAVGLLGWVPSVMARHHAYPLFYPLLVAYLASIPVLAVLINRLSLRYNAAKVLVDAWKRNRIERLVEVSALTLDRPKAEATSPLDAMMAHIRSHLDDDPRTLAAAEAAYLRLTKIAAELQTTREVGQSMTPGSARSELADAATRLGEEYDTIQATLARLHVALLNRAGDDERDGKGDGKELAETLGWLEAKAEVSALGKSAKSQGARPERAASTRQASRDSNT